MQNMIDQIISMALKPTTSFHGSAFYQIIQYSFINITLALLHLTLMNMARLDGGGKHIRIIVVN